MRRDPKLPGDGSCAVCGGARRPERSRRYGAAHAEGDPFCSSSCARAFHGNPLPSVALTSGLSDMRRRGLLGLKDGG